MYDKTVALDAVGKLAKAPSVSEYKSCRIFVDRLFTAFWDMSLTIVVF